jgi:hypothetical protein
LTPFSGPARPRMRFVAGIANLKFLYNPAATQAFSGAWPCLEYPTAVSGPSVPEISTIRAPQHQRIVSSTSSGEMPCRLMCAVFPPASSALSHSKLSIRTGSPRLDCIPTCGRTTYCPERMLHGTQKLLDRPQVTAVLHSLLQTRVRFPMGPARTCRIQVPDFIAR